MRAFLPLLGLLCLTSCAHPASVASGNGPLERQGDEENDQIIGGTAACISSFPSLGFLTIDGQFQCGGSLYKSKYVLTAAHCIDGVIASKIKVYFNSTTRTPAPGHIMRTVKSVKKHAGYGGEERPYNDIAILALSSPITTLPSVTLGSANAGTIGTLAGWGLTKASDQNSGSPILRKVSLPILDNASCAAKYKGTPVLISPKLLCAAAPGKDGCSGDSGSPFYFGSTQIGINSVGYSKSSSELGCANEYPGLFTRVSEYATWISSTIATL